MTTKVHFIGDTHADWDGLNRAMASCPDADLFIQVGDFGFWPPYRQLPIIDKPLLFVDGNHENHEALASAEIEIAPNVWRIPRASHINFNGVKINCIGGAQSVDKHRRTEGVDWFANEVPSYAELNAFADLPEADIIVGHTAPISIIKQCFPYSLYPGFSQVEHSLQAIWEGLGYTPQAYIYGHWHEPMRCKTKGTEFVCVPCVHQWNNVPPSDGVTVTFDNGIITSIT